MSDTIEQTRILVVDISPAMLHVLRTFYLKHSYDADCFADPEQACESLKARFQNFNADYRCIVIGWPNGSVELLAEFLSLMDTADHCHMPLIVVCQKKNQQIEALVKRRPKTHVLLWKEYQQSASIIDRFSVSPVTKSPVTQPGSHNKTTETRMSVQLAGKSILLLDTVPSICYALRDVMQTSGYQVTVVGTVAAARASVKEHAYDAVVSDFFPSDESGEAFCKFLQEDRGLKQKPVCIVITAKYSDAVIKRSLAAGAIACLYKNESTDLLFTRINALVRPHAQQEQQGGDANAQQGLLNQVLDLVEQPSVMLDENNTVMAVNQQATSLLAGEIVRELCGTDFTAIFKSIGLVSQSLRAIDATFVTADGNQLAVRYRVKTIVSDQDKALRLLGFEVATTDVAPIEKNSGKIAQVHKTTEIPVKTSSTEVPNSVQKLDDAASVDAPQIELNTADKKRKPALAVAPPVETADIPEHSMSTDSDSGVAQKCDDEPVHTECELFEKRLAKLLVEKSVGLRRFVLMLDIQIIAVTGDRLCLGDSEPLLKIVNQSLRKLYPRENSLAYLGDGKFAFILATRTLQDALVLSRKVLQVTPQMVRYLNNMTLVSHGAVMPLAVDPTLGAAELVKQCSNACSKTRTDKRDNAALVICLNQYLTANSVQKAAMDEEAEPLV